MPPQMGGSNVKTTGLPQLGHVTDTVTLLIMILVLSPTIFLKDTLFHFQSILTRS